MKSENEIFAGTTDQKFMQENGEKLTKLEIGNKIFVPMKEDKKYPFTKAMIGNTQTWPSIYHMPSWAVQMPWYVRLWGLLTWKLKKQRGFTAGWYEVKSVTISDGNTRVTTNMPCESPPPAS